MHPRKLILDALRARIGTAWPDAEDVTQDAHGPEDKRLPAYALNVEPGDSEVVAMGAPARFIVTDQVEVFAWDNPTGDAEAAMYAMAETLGAALFATPAHLGGLVRFIELDGSDVEVSRGAKRVAKLSIRLSIQFTHGG